MNQICIELNSAAEGRSGSSWHRIGETVATGSRVARQALGEAQARVAQWHARQRQRRALMSLGDAELKDIGLGRSEAYREYAKPFWRA
jgi:uncharacterized protein YjiS (DUF1127 family)